MSLVALDGTPLVIVGAPILNGVSGVLASTSITQDAANEACIMIGQVFNEDSGSHTIDTTGSSSIGWRSGSVTFANGGTTFVVGIAPVNTTAGPPGRASNVADVISFDVFCSMVGGGGGVTANSWQTNVPTSGTKTIAHGDFVAVCTQMTTLGGADSVITQFASGSKNRPTVTGFTGGSYASGFGVPNAVITYSDGKLGFFYGGFVFDAGLSTQTWNSGSATKEYGNFIQLPFPAKIYGIISASNHAGDADIILYSDPLGTPVAEKTVSVDLNTVLSAANRWAEFLFPAPYSATASQPLAAIVKPTSATNITNQYVTMNSSSHQKSLSCGTNGYAVNRASGAFAAQNSSKDRFNIGLLVGAFDDATAGGSIMVQTNTVSISDYRAMIPY
jgi:hypothetical protein